LPALQEHANYRLLSLLSLLLERMTIASARTTFPASRRLLSEWSGFEQFEQHPQVHAHMDVGRTPSGRRLAKQHAAFSCRRCLALLASLSPFSFAPGRLLAPTAAAVAQLELLALVTRSLRRTSLARTIEMVSLAQVPLARRMRLQQVAVRDCELRPRLYLLVQAYLQRMHSSAHAAVWRTGVVEEAGVEVHTTTE